jgi:hypothetical protein
MADRVDSIDEAIARALCEADGKDPDADWRRHPVSGASMDVVDDEPQEWRPRGG